MRFLLDQDVYAVTARLLRDLGHDVAQAIEIAGSKATDSNLLRTSEESGRIFVTRDRDFGSLVFIQGIRVGVIYLRLQPTTVTIVHQELETILTSYSENQLRSAFVVVEPGRHRFRGLS
jgi:predicted nuclease of predicted toxin-antitoxin system